MTLRLAPSYPRNVLEAQGAVDADGNVTPQGVALGVRKECTAGGACGYYAYLQGTSMAAPHASGVAALIVSQYGRKDPNHRGRTMKPDNVERILTSTAAQQACPVPPLVDYLDEGRDASYTALCEGTPEFNGFYGHGIVDAFAAVTGGAGG